MRCFKRLELQIGVALLIATSAVRVPPAYAQLNVPHPTSVTAVAHAPVDITRCKILTDAPGVGTAGVVNLYNLTAYYLESVEVRWTFFNHSGDKMGEFLQNYRPLEHLAPRDAQLMKIGLFNMSLTDPIDSLGRAACRIQSATFEGNREWEYGRAWSGKLFPPPKK